MGALFFENLPFGIVLCFTAIITIAFKRHIRYNAVIKWGGGVFQGILLLLTVVGSGLMFMWVKAFKNGPSKICGRQSLKKLK